MISYTKHNHSSTEICEVLRIGTDDDVSNNLNSITEDRDKTTIADDVEGKDNSTGNSIRLNYSTNDVMKNSNTSLRCDNEKDDYENNSTQISDEMSDNIKEIHTKNISTYIETYNKTCLRNNNIASIYAKVRIRINDTQYNSLQSEYKHLQLNNPSASNDPRNYIEQRES